MKALILNSGLGSRMGALASGHPKCMTEIFGTETILSRQLRQLSEVGITEVVITTGPFADVLTAYCESLHLPIRYTFVPNPLYRETNYIYSIFCAREYLDDDLLLLHGDLVFENTVLDRVLSCPTSCMTVSTSVPLPEKDFKAVVRNGRIEKVGVEFFTDAVAAQPLYLLRRPDWRIWLDRIALFCESGESRCYAEKALNTVTDQMELFPLDVGTMLCAEVDNADDLASVSECVKTVENRLVYMCFSTDLLHGGHIAILRKAKRLGRLMIGVLSDEAVASYKRFPLVPFADRKAMLENLAGVACVVEQRTLSYRENLERYRPAFVVHGDDWTVGVQKPIRDEVIEVLSSYGGRLVEFPYAKDAVYREIESRSRADLAMPDLRRGRLRRILEIKSFATAMEAHDGLTGLIVEHSVLLQDGGAHQFDAMWFSSLCDSTAKGKPDMELVDMTSRFRTMEDILEVTTKPIIFDGDTGGRPEQFVYTVRSLERLGVSMVIIEDKTGSKKNSLFGTEVEQTQDSVERFAAKIAAGKHAQKTKTFMICARIESLILERGMDDALSRAFAYVEAGADAIMIHSRQKDPTEIFTFVDRFRKQDQKTYLVVVPTAFPSVTEEEFRIRGVNLVIYANQLMRAAVPAYRAAATSILEHHRALECDSMLMPFSEIIRMIPEE